MENTVMNESSGFVKLTASEQHELIEAIDCGLSSLHKKAKETLDGMETGLTYDAIDRRIDHLKSARKKIDALQDKND